jgi:preprotein translocase subunit SecG
MVILLTIIHVVVCLFLIIVVLLQSGKAADLAGAFGGMGSQTAFGPRGAATVLSKATTIAAGLFMLTSLTLAIMASRGMSGGGGSSVLEKAAPVKPAQTTQQAPAKQAPASDSSTPVMVTPGKGPVVPGQPSVTISTEDGKNSKTMPLDIKPVPPGQLPPAQQQKK